MIKIFDFVQRFCKGFTNFRMPLYMYITVVMIAVLIRVHPNQQRKPYIKN